MIIIKKKKFGSHNFAEHRLRTGDLEYIIDKNWSVKRKQSSLDGWSTEKIYSRISRSVNPGKYLRQRSACKLNVLADLTDPALLSFRTPVTIFNRNGNRFATLWTFSLPRDAPGFIIDPLSFSLSLFTWRNNSFAPPGWRSSQWSRRNRRSRCISRWNGERFRYVANRTWFLDAIRLEELSGFALSRQPRW